MTEWFRLNRPDVIDEHFEDEYVIVNLKTGAYYSLNLAGAAIWDAIGSGNSRQGIRQQLLDTYSSDPAELDARLGSFLDELAQEQLVVLSSGAPVNAPPKSPSPAATRVPFEIPRLEKYTDMRDLLLLDPIHQVDDSGWPLAKPDAN